MSEVREAQQLSSVPPRVQAILLCEKIIVEQGTNKKTLIGVFDQVNLPATGQLVGVNVSVFARILDAVGDYRFKCQYAEAESGEILVTGETQIVSIPDPLVAHDLYFALGAVPVPRPGRYEFLLYANEAYLTHVTMRALSSPPRPQ